MKHESHSIIFKDEEGRWKYQDLVDAANSCEKNHAQMKGALMYIDTLVARLEAHDCFVDAREKAYKAGNNSPYAYRADEILCEHWIHGDWLKEAKRKSTECRDLAIAICVPINVIIAVIMSPIWLPFLAIWAASIKISDYLPEESRVQNILARIAVATGVPTTLIPGIVCEVVDRPIELLADFCQERVNSKTILP